MESGAPPQRERGSQSQPRARLAFLGRPSSVVSPAVLVPAPGPCCVAASCPTASPGPPGGSSRPRDSSPSRYETNLNLVRVEPKEGGNYTIRASNDDDTQHLSFFLQVNGEEVACTPPCTRVRIHTCMHIDAHSHVHSYIYAHTCVHMHAHTCTPLCMHAHVYTCTHVYTHVHPCAHAYVHMHMHTRGRPPEGWSWSRPTGSRGGKLLDISPGLSLQPQSPL